MADKMSNEQIATFKELFEIYDKNGDGVITSNELGAVMKALGQNPTEAELQKMIATADADKNGVIDFPEFLNLMAIGLDQDPDSDESLLEAFTAIDKDQDGFISAGELRDLLRGLGQVVTDEEVIEMIQRADLDGDGKVSFDEFKRLMLAK